MTVGGGVSGYFFFFFKQKTAYEITVSLEFRRVLFRSSAAGAPAPFVCNRGPDVGEPNEDRTLLVAVPDRVRRGPGVDPSLAPADQLGSSRNGHHILTLLDGEVVHHP